MENPKTNIIPSTFVATLVICIIIAIPAIADSSAIIAPFKYRAVSVHTGQERDPAIILDLPEEMLRLAHRLGFNDLTIITEVSMEGKMEALREHADRHGYFKLAKDLGMTLSVWVREFSDYDRSLLPPPTEKPTVWEPERGDYDEAFVQMVLASDKLWQAVSQRYQRILNDVLPEIDYLVLTVVESEIWVTKDARILTKLVNTINDQCRAAGKKLVLRTFVWFPEEMDVVLQTIAQLPSDVIIQSKCVPQDWHLRSIHNPAIGSVGDRDQFVEFDIAGEYFKKSYVACCFTDVLEEQVKYAREKHCDGISVRIDRFGHWVRGNPQEANLWFLGYWASGKSFDSEQIWKEYAAAAFGKKSAPAMIEALRPTGKVIAEAICVERETFGDPRWPDFRMTDTLKNYVAPEGPSPFNQNFAVYKWDKSLVPAFEKLNIGDPEIIKRKTESFENALASAKKSLELIDSIKNDLPEGAYPFFRFKLEENRFCLTMCCNMQLAWLKAVRRAHTRSQEEKSTLLKEINGHVAAVETELAGHGSETLTVTWLGQTHDLTRGPYHNWTEWLDAFRHYAGLQ
jgi:hypothetical protein